MTLQEALEKGPRGRARYDHNDMLIEVRLLPAGECKIVRAFWGSYVCPVEEVGRNLMIWWDVPTREGWEPV